MRARWLPLIIGGAWNPELRRAFDRNSGAYAVRETKSKRVLYVGESHTGRGWKTLTRHFQDASGKFAKVRETFVHSRPAELEAALWVTSKGARKPEQGDQRALNKQAALIASFRKAGHELVNVDDGRAAVDALRTSGRDRRLGKPPPPMADDDFAFGANVNPKKPPLGLERRDADGRYNHGMDRVCGRCGHRKGEHEAEKPYAQDDASSGFQCDGFKAAREKKNPPALPAPNVAAERKAENRTPDLFTGRTKLEEGGKGARKDWKGEAERTARELAECKRGAPSTKKAASDTTGVKIEKSPPPKPEGFGELDAKGQAGMFKRNPTDLVALGHLVSIAYQDDNGRRRVLKFGVRFAPILAYRPTGRLVIIHAPVVVGSSSSKGAAEYKRTHWGKAGDGERLAGDVLAGKAKRLGMALEITYATEKGGDSSPVDYWHTFGDFGPLARKKPFLRPCLRAEYVGGRLMVRLDGGTYTVTSHGIVG